MVHTKSFGTYSDEDVIFLLKDISEIMHETSTMDREEQIQAGKHYSEMLPIENEPTQEYKNLFFTSLQLNKRKIAEAVRVIAEEIIKQKGNRTILVSLARAGTPVGILVKRYILAKYKISLPHYSVSIIRGRGIDENAIYYLRKLYPDYEFQFIDGWTGKGAIKLELDNSLQKINQESEINISNSLAVLADPGQCADIYGTREDFLIPNACLNATVSGLISRTVLNQNVLKSNDFHGAKFYRELSPHDVSNYFIDEISKQFELIVGNTLPLTCKMVEPNWSGLREVQSIQEKFKIKDKNLIKPGVGETTRVLLRRVPWKILVRDKMDKNVSHILLLAKERKVPIEEYDLMSYSCCGIIKSVK
ncbi:MAG: cysteine protease StiP family protein [Heyndrickxia sp.]